MNINQIFFLNLQNKPLPFQGFLFSLIFCSKVLTLFSNLMCPYLKYASAIRVRENKTNETPVNTKTTVNSLETSCVGCKSP